MYMVPEWSRRRTLHLSSAVVLTGLTGCSTLGINAQPRVDSSLGTTAYEAVIDGQPTPEEDVPAVWGILFAHPDTTGKLINWGALTPVEGDSGPGTELRTFDPDTQFVSVIVGVLPTGDGLVSYRPRTALDAERALSRRSHGRAGHRTRRGSRVRPPTARLVRAASSSRASIRSGTGVDPAHGGEHLFTKLPTPPACLSSMC